MIMTGGVFWMYWVKRERRPVGAFTRDLGFAVSDDLEEPIFGSANSCETCARVKKTLIST